MSKFTELIRLAIEIADDSVREELNSGCKHTTDKDGVWFDVENDIDEGFVDSIPMAVDYLRARGMLVEHPTDKGKVQISSISEEFPGRSQALAQWKSLMGEYFMGPPDGRCFTCNTDLVKIWQETSRFSSSGCIKCNHSFVE